MSNKTIWCRDPTKLTNKILYSAKIAKGDRHDMQSYLINNFQIHQTYIQSLVQVFTLPNFKDDVI